MLNFHFEHKFFLLFSDVNLSFCALSFLLLLLLSLLLLNIRSNYILYTLIPYLF